MVRMTPTHMVVAQPSALLLSPQMPGVVEVVGSWRLPLIYETSELGYSYSLAMPGCAQHGPFDSGLPVEETRGLFVGG